MTELIGLVLLYAYVHATIICFKKLHGLTQYEKTVSLVAFIGLVLTLIGLVIG